MKLCLVTFIDKCGCPVQTRPRRTSYAAERTAAALSPGCQPAWSCLHYHQPQHSDREQCKQQYLTLSLLIGSSRSPPAAAHEQQREDACEQFPTFSLSSSFYHSFFEVQRRQQQHQIVTRRRDRSSTSIEAISPTKRKKCARTENIFL